MAGEELEAHLFLLTLANFKLPTAYAMAKEFS